MMLTTEELVAHAPSAGAPRRGGTSALRRGSSAALRRLRRAAFTPTSPSAASAGGATYPLSAPPSPADTTTPAATARLPRHHGTPQHTHDAAPRDDLADAHALAVATRRRDLCTPHAETEEVLSYWESMAKYETSVMVGMDVFCGVVYAHSGVGDPSEEEDDPAYVDCE